MPVTQDLLIRNVRPLAGALVDVRISNGRIADIKHTITQGTMEVVDGEGAIMLPGLVEAHAHLDKSVLGMKWYRNEVGPRLGD